MLNRDDIKKILPHREPMLLVDNVEMCSDGNSCTGYYTVKGDEFFLQGHFPGNPIVPGVILCEMMAQSCGMLFDLNGSIALFSSLNNVKFRAQVKPGDTVRFECKKARDMGQFVFASGIGYVGDKMCVKADLSFALVETNSQA